MRQRNKGFARFMKQLDGDKEHDNFSETEGLGGGVYQRYECLLGLLRAEYDWRTYLGRVLRISAEERYACLDLRGYLGLHIPTDTVGVYIEDRGLYEQAIEYLREYQTCEQQDDVQEGVESGISIIDSEDPYFIHDASALLPW